MWDGNYTYIVPARNLHGSLINYDDGEIMSLEQALVATATISASVHAIHCSNPSIEEIGDLSNWNNYLPNSGDTQHMTPRSADLINMVEGQRLGVEVAYGPII